MVGCAACPGVSTSDPLTDVAAERYAIAVDSVHGPLARPAAPGWKH